MADITISSLPQGLPTGNSILPYSTGSSTLRVPVSAIFQNAGDVRLGGRLAIGAVDDPGPTQYNLELRGSNPTRGVLGLVYNNAVSSNSGAMIQYTQRGLGDWAMGCTAGGVNGFSLYRGRGVNSDGTEAMRFDTNGNVEFFGAVKATQFGEVGTWSPGTNITGATLSTDTTQTLGGYVKMGRYVYVYGRVQFTNKNNYNSGPVQFTGLPFKNINQAYASEGNTISFNWWSGMNSSGANGSLGIISGYVVNNSRLIYLIHQVNGSSTAYGLDGSYLTNGSVFYFSGSYITD